MVYSADVKKKAALLHRRGFSYAAIKEELGIPKSTLSTWIGKNPRTPSNRKKQRAHLARIRIIAAATKRRQKEEWIAQARGKGKAVARKVSYDENTSKALLAMLYWAEGSKFEKVHGVRFANTDPWLMLLFMTLLRKTYSVQENKIRIRIHVHYYHEQKSIRTFWSKTLSVPKSQFGKIYVKKRGRHKRFRKNSKGICYFSYGDSKIREELLGLGYALAEQLKQAPVV